MSQSRNNPEDEWTRVSNNGCNIFANNHNQRTPVSKWKISKFTGKEEKLPRFLSNVTQFALAEGISKEEVFRNRIHLVAGDAADFVAISSHIGTWDELVQELTRYCLGSTSDTDLLLKIERKKQASESCTIYCTRMELMFRSLQRPLSDQEKVEIIILGLRPEIRQSLAGIVLIRTVHELQLAAQRVEKLLLHPNREYNRSLSAVDQGWDRSPQSRQHERPTNTYRNSNRGGSRTREPQKEEKCFRCGMAGHMSLQCAKEPKGSYCFGCGAPGIIKPNCPQCSGNGQRQGH